MGEMRHIVLREHPLSQTAGVFPVHAGQTLEAMLREGAQGAELSELIEVRIGGEVVPRAWWPRVTPKAGTVIEVTGTPQGGSAGTILRSVAMIAVMALAGWAAPILAASAFGQAMVMGGIMMAGTLAVNALIPPPTPGGLGDTSRPRWNQLTGSQNQINPDGVIPIVLGEHRYFPPHAARPYTISSGAKSVQHCLFDLGYNVEPDDVDMESCTIGGSPLSSYKGVRWELTKNPTLYRNDVREQVVNATLDSEGEVVVRSAAPGSDEVSLVIVFPDGLEYINTSGVKKSYWALFRFEYRPVSGGAWLPLPSPRYSHHIQPSGGNAIIRGRYIVPFAATVAFDVPDGVDVEVRLSRLDNGDRSSVNTYRDTATYFALQSIRHASPSRTGTLKLAMAIEANDQLNGPLQTLALTVRPKFPVYDEATGTWSKQRTVNTGWIYRWLLTECPATLRKVRPERIHMDQVLDFVDFCERHGFGTRMVLDTPTTLGNLLDQVLATSGGSRTMTDGKYGVTFLPEEKPEFPLVYAGSEVDNFTVQRAFTRIPHALRVKFRNSETHWEPDEIVVVDDGYSYRGMDARGNPSSLPEATTFEDLDLQASMPPAQAWRMGRMHFAQAKFSPATYSFKSDIAALRITKGTAMDVPHELTAWGGGFGRVLSLTAGGPTGAATLVLDADIETDPTKSYRMQIRTPQGTQVFNATPHSPRTGTFYLDAMPTGVERNDLGVLGEATVERPILLATHVRGNKDLEFTVQAVKWDARVAPYWANPPDEFVSEVTGVRYTEAPDPPRIIGVSPIERTNDAGVSTPGFAVGVVRTSGYERLEPARQVA